MGECGEGFYIGFFFWEWFYVWCFLCYERDNKVERERVGCDVCFLEEIYICGIFKRVFLGLYERMEYIDE